MDPRRSLQIYPRQDVVFKTKQSFNFEVLTSKIFSKRPANKRITLSRWLAHTMAGVGTGTFAFLMATTEEYLTKKRSDTT